MISTLRLRATFPFTSTAVNWWTFCFVCEPNRGIIGVFLLFFVCLFVCLFFMKMDSIHRSRIEKKT